jgi:hypothetical protein
LLLAPGTNWHRYLDIQPFDDENNFEDYFLAKARKQVVMALSSAVLRRIGVHFLRFASSTISSF